MGRWVVDRRLRRVAQGRVGLNAVGGWTRETKKHEQYLNVDEPKTNIFSSRGGSCSRA